MKTECIGIIGLGYVGLPLMANLNRSFDVKGYDIDAHKIANLMSSVDLTDSIDNENLEKLKTKVFDQIEELKDCSVFIVTVPTPIDSNFNPDLHALELACQKVSKLLKINDLVIFESTVYPGTTEEICVPLLEESGLIYNIDFSVGYSPERVNPGDSNQTIDKINFAFDLAGKGVTFLLTSLQSVGATSTFCSENHFLMVAIQILRLLIGSLRTWLSPYLNIILKREIVRFTAAFNYPTMLAPV